MKDKRVEVILLVVVSLIVLSIKLRIQEKKVVVDNAAVYYLKAFDLLKYPVSKEVQRKLFQIVIK